MTKIFFCILSVGVTTPVTPPPLSPLPAGLWCIQLSRTLGVLLRTRCAISFKIRSATSRRWSSTAATARCSVRSPWFGAMTSSTAPTSQLLVVVSLRNNTLANIRQWCRPGGQALASRPKFCGLTIALTSGPKALASKVQALVFSDVGMKARPWT